MSAPNTGDELAENQGSVDKPAKGSNDKLEVIDVDMMESRVVKPAKDTGELIEPCNEGNLADDAEPLTVRIRWRLAGNTETKQIHHACTVNTTCSL